MSPLSKIKIRKITSVDVDKIVKQISKEPHGLAKLEAIRIEAEGYGMEVKPYLFEKLTGKMEEKIASVRQALDVAVMEADEELLKGASWRRP